MKVFLTGGTGFLGQYLLAELLGRGHQVFALYRSEAKRRATEEFLAGEGLGGRLGEPRWLKGELLSLPGLWEGWLKEEEGFEEIDSLLHAAANLSFKPDESGEPYRTNVEGAKALGRLNHGRPLKVHLVSTAYVCGLVEGGLVREVLHPRGRFLNSYEESKWEAEQAWTGKATILRPGIITGQSRSGRCTSFTGWYAVIRGVHALSQLLDRVPGGREADLGLMVPADPEARANLIPVDYAAQAAVRVIEDPANHQGIFHLTHPDPPAHQWVHEIVCARFGLGGIRFVGRRAALPKPRNDLQRFIRRQVRLMLPYFRANPSFDRTNLDRALPDLAVPPISREYLERIIDYAVSTDWGRVRTGPGRMKTARQGDDLGLAGPDRAQAPERSLVYRFPSLEGFGKVELEVRSSKGRLETRLTGERSRLLAPFIDNYFNWLNRTGPLALGEEGNVYSLYLPPVPGPAHARMLDGFLFSWLKGKARPKSLTLDVTEECQCDCGHCSTRGGRKEGEKLGFGDLARVVEESLELGVTSVFFAGGEPLLSPDLESLIESIAPRLAVGIIFTNGLTLDRARAESLTKAGLYSVMVSLDAPEPEVHDRSRGCPGLFDAVREAVRAAREAGLLVGLSTYATNDFVERGWLERMAGLAAEWGVQELTVLDLIPTGRLLRRDDLLLTRKNRSRLLKEGRSLFKRYGGRPRVMTQTWTNSPAWFAASYGCLAGSYEFHVTARGEFTPCTFTPLSLGNVRKETVAALWERLTSHPAWCRHQAGCRMQSPEFRARYIRPIPEEGPLPYPIGLLNQPPK